MAIDVHEESIDVTVAEEGALGEVRNAGTIGGDLDAVAKLARRLRRKGRVLRFVRDREFTAEVAAAREEPEKRRTRPAASCTVRARMRNR